MKFLVKLVSCVYPTERIVASEEIPPQKMELEAVVLKTFAVTDERLALKKPGGHWRPSLCEISEDTAAVSTVEKKPIRVVVAGGKKPVRGVGAGGKKLTVDTRPMARVQSYNYDQSPSPSPRRSPTHMLLPGFSPTGFFF